MFGLLNVCKPSGITSRQVVDRVLRLVRPAKAGHAGTLDPLASGVLVVCVGPATRLIEYVQAMPKRYTGTFLLGRESDTEDIEGQVTELADPPRPSRAEIAGAAASLVGEIQQRPPAYSALKVHGRRAYDLARRGEAVELAPRTIQVYGIDIVRYEYPELVLDVRCGSGTYVRSLGRDLAERLGTAAVMSALARTQVGPFLVGEAVLLDELSAATLARRLQSPLRAVESIPKLTLSAEELAEIALGRTIRREAPAEAREIAALDPAGHLVALLAPRGPGVLGPSRNFRSSE